MALERRAGGVYYYRSRRVNGRVVKEYAGCGRVATLAAELDGLDRDQAAIDREREKRTRDELAALDGPLAELNDLTDLLARAALVAAGYRQHHRGEWRKRREPGE
jgi:hypothetical protein